MFDYWDKCNFNLVAYLHPGFYTLEPLLYECEVDLLFLFDYEVPLGPCLEVVFLCEHEDHSSSAVQQTADVEH